MNKVINFNGTVGTTLDEVLYRLEKNIPITKDVVKRLKEARELSKAEFNFILEHSIKAESKKNGVNIPKNFTTQEVDEIRSISIKGIEDGVYEGLLGSNLARFTIGNAEVVIALEVGFRGANLKTFLKVENGKLQVYA
jgi:hypothetical protein